jgi:hypothetical protein
MSLSVSYDSIFIICVIHVLFSGSAILDLITISKRKFKMLWGFIILFIPFLGAFLYRVTMTRSSSRLFF